MLHAPHRSLGRYRKQLIDPAGWRVKYFRSSKVKIQDKTKAFKETLMRDPLFMQSSGIRVKIKLSDRDGSEAASADIANGRSHGNGTDVVNISDEDDDVIMQVFTQACA